MRFFAFIISVSVAQAWTEWKYKTTWASGGPTSQDFTTRTTVWNQQWNADPNSYNGIPQPPRARRGHSLHLITTDINSEYKGDTYLVLFGGRDNDQKTQHIPKTYDVKEVNGSIVFTTYDAKPVNKCNDLHNLYYSPSETAGCNYNTTSTIDVGEIYNDVWAYKICDYPERGWDSACNETGWECWFVGALQGGCTIQLGILVCTAPSERYNHGSVMFDDGTLYVYGGFSQRCADYCDDLWYFDIYMKSWRQIYGTGQLTRFNTDTYFDVTYDLDPNMVPIDNTTTSIPLSQRFRGPGARWRHSMAVSERYQDPNNPTQILQQFALYGGHRLWQGYSTENSQDNNWDQYITRPKGGYLDDLWVYTKVLDFTTFPGSAFRKVNGNWTIRTGTQQCVLTPGLAWTERYDQTCSTTAPVGRAGHGSAFDSARNRIWLFGGYTSYYPYLRTDGEGSGKGVESVGTGGFIPYPGYDFFRNDLWYYDLNASLWTEITFPDGATIPDGRMDAVFLLLGDYFFLHGGYADNHIYSDTWYFNINTSSWLQKTKFVYPLYSDKCTDDIKYIQENNCTLLQYPLHLNRSENYPFSTLKYQDQNYYWPDPNFGPYYYGIFPIETDLNTSFYSNFKVNNFAKLGTPEVPYAATGPNQYVREFSYTYTNGSGVNVTITLYERCTSVAGEPTRGKLLDGLAGRSKVNIFIPQPRLQRPGWDGCRDRSDGRTDLPNELQYIMPSGRFGHRAVFIKNSSEILMYGGMAYAVDQPISLNFTYNSSVVSEMWYFNLYHCINNCSNHGTCFYGFCTCFDGYYGEDCSNTSCPGTYCYYDTSIFQQICTFACQAGYNHTDNDTYIPDIAKLPCSPTTSYSFESNGVCDGFGSNQCAPPYVGDDCSIKDCKNNCSFHGWCSIEYPVSRCLCMPGYYGEICEYKICLNNCTYPNGVCNATSGECKCRMMYSPYNNTRAFQPWGGQDCSYIFAYASATKIYSLDFSVLLSIATLILFFAVEQFVFQEADRDK